MSPTGAEAGAPRPVSLPTRRLARPDRRRAILRGAAAAFAARGFAATSMEDVATAGGVTRLILYRHFDSKRSLYDAVLEQVSEQLAEAFSERIRPGTLAVGAAMAMLSVARSDPDGYALLWRHAVREPEFADHANSIRSRVVAGAEDLLASLDVVDRGTVRRWAAATMVAYLVEGVLAWLEEGDPALDERFMDMMARSLPALVRSWSPAPVIPVVEA